MLLAPGFGRDFWDLMIGHIRQPAEHVAQVRVRIQSSAPAAFNDSVKDRPALAGTGPYFDWI
jgi:hypothetical protein